MEHLGTSLHIQQSEDDVDQNKYREASRAQIGKVHSCPWPESRAFPSSEHMQCYHFPWSVVLHLGQLQLHVPM